MRNARGKREEREESEISLQAIARPGAGHKCIFQGRLGQDAIQALSFIRDID